MCRCARRGDTKHQRKKTDEIECEYQEDVDNVVRSEIKKGEIRNVYHRWNNIAPGANTIAEKGVKLYGR